MGFSCYLSVGAMKSLFSVGINGIDYVFVVLKGSCLRPECNYFINKHFGCALMEMLQPVSVGLFIGDIKLVLFYPLPRPPRALSLKRNKSVFF